MCSINYKLIGCGKNLIVFLHGFGGGFSSFAEIAEKLKSRYRCLLISFFDAEPDVPLKLDDYVNYVSELLENSKAQKIIVVGHSFGGRVAMRLACQGECDKLILVDSAGLKPKRGLKYYFKVYSYKIKKRLKMNVDNFGSADYRSLSPVMKKTFINIVNTYQDQELEQIVVPTLLFWGEKDKETPLRFAKKMKKNIKNSKLIIAESCGHFSYLQAKDLFYNCLRSFCG